MFPLQTIFTATEWMRSPDIPGQVAGDVLFHPELVRMTPRQLADLPFPRGPQDGPGGIGGDGIDLKRCA